LKESLEVASCCKDYDVWSQEEVMKEEEGERKERDDFWVGSLLVWLLTFFECM